MSLRRYLNLALKEASKSKCNQRLGCVAISSNRVVSKGFNDIFQKHKIPAERRTCYSC